jgi:hypothetical protein
MKSIVVLIFIILFSGCSQTPNISSEPFALPYYSKENGNLYILNMQDSSTIARKNASVEIYCKNDKSYKSIVKTTQYAYFNLPNKECKLYIQSYSYSPPIFGTRDGVSTSLNIKRGEIKYIDIDFSMDSKAWLKFFFATFSNSQLDPKIDIEENQKHFNKLKRIITFTPYFNLPRLYPAEATYY